MEEIYFKPFLVGLCDCTTEGDKEAFKVLQNIITDENTLKDLKYLTKFSHRSFGNISHALQQMGSKKPIFFLTWNGYAKSVR